MSHLSQKVHELRVTLFCFMVLDGWCFLRAVQPGLSLLCLPPLRITALAVSESLVISFLRPMDKSLCQSSFVVCPRCRVIRVKPGSWHLIRNDSLSWLGPDPEIPAAGRMDSPFVWSSKEKGLFVDWSCLHGICRTCSSTAILSWIFVGIFLPAGIVPS